MKPIMPDRHIAPSPVDHASRPNGSTVIVLACLAVCAALLIGTANRGFGLTDEAFYVAWIGAPEQYRANITPFGPPLHLAFVLLGRSLIALRIAGVTLLMVSGAMLGHALVRYYHAIGLIRVPSTAIVALGGVAGLSYYALWILTPSYNLLANAGGAVLLAGALNWVTADVMGDRRGAMVAAVLTGMGGCMAFFGKPPLAGLAVLCVGGLVVRTAYFHGLRAVAARLIVVLLACFIPLIAIIAISGGLADFTAKFFEGVRVLDFGNSPLSIPLKTFRSVFENSLLVLAGVLLILILAWSRGSTADASDNRPQLRRTFGVMLGFVGLYAAVLLVKGVVSGERAWTFVGLPTACLAIVVLAAGALRDTKTVMPWRVVAPPIVLLLVPFATALGTANRFVHQTGASPYGFLLAAPIGAWIFLSTRTAARVQAATALFTLAMLGWSATKPYSLTDPIWAQNTPVRVPFSSDVVLVSPETHRYAQALRRVAIRGRLLPDTPIIDLSAGGPGTALFLNAQAPFYPWIIHETRVSGSLADEIWRSLDTKQRRAAWIVGPIRPEFAQTQLGRTLSARQTCYQRFGGLRMIFWDEVKMLEIWVPKGVC